MKLLCPPGVYRAQTDTAVLIRSLVRSGLAAGSHVLDIGTGCGALALAASRAGAASVTAVDLSHRSVLTARLNCLLHGALVSVRRGDLFGPVGQRRFDLVLANPPYLPARTAVLPRHRVARCWNGGLNGRVVIDRICAAAAERLTARGVLLMVHSGVCGRYDDQAAGRSRAGRCGRRTGPDPVRAGDADARRHARAAWADRAGR
jgi:release factor glutamine methyltransferase